MLKFLRIFLFLSVFALTFSLESEADYEYLCESETVTIFPQKGETKYTGSMFIQNSAEHKQAVEVEICKNVGQPCKYNEGCFPNGYTPICKQNYIYRTLIAVTSNGTLTEEKFKMPSACKCAIIKKLELN